MFRKVGMAALAGALVAPLIVAPVAAVEPVAEDAVEATAPPLPITDPDGDGLAETAVVLPLAADGRAVDVAGATTDEAHEHVHQSVAQRSGRLQLQGEPQSLILEEVPAGTHLAIRSRNDGTWTDWTEVVASPYEAPDGALDRTPGVGPVWLGTGAEAFEVAVLSGDVAEIDVVVLRSVDDGASPVQGVRASAATTKAPSAASSFIKPRSAWATSDMTWACSGSPSDAGELDAMVVHHTATHTGDLYQQSEVPDIIRSYWRYHVKTRKWCDVAYAFFVDRFGGVWEGRQGGIDKAIVGGHTYGFNTGTTSVAQIGNFQSDRTPTAMTSATRQLIGWKLGHHDVDPSGTTTITNRTGSTVNGVPNGGQVRVATVSGHRDLGQTSCPGTHTYDTLPYLRAHSKLGVHLVALHETFLRRSPDPDDYDHWLGVADTKGARAAALGMARSEEYSGLIIDDLYQRVLGRDADDDGKEYWLEVLASGTRVEDVGALFYGSSEYVAEQGTTRSYIAALYENLLHRDPEEDGLDYWVDMIRSGRARPPQVARGFYASLESRLDRVERLYDTILGRDPDRAGQTHWARKLLDTDDVVLAVELALSDEFYERGIS